MLERGLRAEGGCIYIGRPPLRPLERTPKVRAAWFLPSFADGERLSQRDIDTAQDLSKGEGDASLLLTCNMCCLKANQSSALSTLRSVTDLDIDPATRTWNSHQSR